MWKEADLLLHGEGSTVSGQHGLGNSPVQRISFRCYGAIPLQPPNSRPLPCTERHFEGLWGATRSL